MNRKHFWFLGLMGLVFLLAAWDGFGATPQGTKTRAIYIAEDLGAATSWDDVVWIKRDSAGNLIWADATHTTSTFSASSVWQRVQPWVFLIDTSDRLGLGLTSATVRLDMKSLGATTTSLRIEAFGTTLSAATLGTDSEAGVLGLFDGSGSSSVSLSGKPGAAQFFNTGGDFGIGTTEPSLNVAGGTADFSGTGFHVKSADTQRIIVEGDAAATLELIDTSAPADEKVIALITSAGNTWFRSRTDALVTVVDNILVIDHDTGNVGIGAASGGEAFEVTGNVKATGDFLVEGGDIGLVADPDILQILNGAAIFNGNLTVTGEMKGSRESVLFTRAATTGALADETTVSLNLGEVDSWFRGAPMPRPGSVVAAGVGYDVTARTGDDDDDDDDTDNAVELIIGKNDVQLWTFNLDNVDSVMSAVTDSDTTARGGYTFAAGDRLSALLKGNAAGSVTLENLSVFLEVVFDD